MTAFLESTASYGAAVTSALVPTFGQALQKGIDDRRVSSSLALSAAFTAAMLFWGPTAAKAVNVPAGAAVSAQRAPVEIGPLVGPMIEARDEMTSVSGLKAGWDGYRSLPISRAAVDSALEFLTYLSFNAVPPEASPSADGTVSWYWNTDRAEITVQFLADGRVGYFADLRGRGAVKGLFRFSGASVPQELLDAISAA